MAKRSDGKPWTSGGAASAVELERMSARIDRWIAEAGWALVPPFLGPKTQALLETIREELKVDAVGLFLSSEADPNRLRFTAGVGYTNEYKLQSYFRGGQSLTSYVFSRGEPINFSAQMLKSGRAGVPFSGACERFILEKRFLNIIAVPIGFEAYSQGVFKIENKKGSTEADRFPEDDFFLAKLFAKLVAIATQQQTYTRLWTTGEQLSRTATNIRDFAAQITHIARLTLHATCSSLFLVDRPVSEGRFLRYVGGDGYHPTYVNHTYEMPSTADRSQSLTSYVAKSMQTIRMNEKEIIDNSLPYTGACASWIPGGVFRNLLAIPLVTSFEDGAVDRKCYGVLKLENKLPADAAFTVHDEECCKEIVAKEIVPAIVRLHEDPAQVPSVDILAKELGAPPDRGAISDDVLRQVLEVRNRRGLAHEACIAFLSLPRPTYFRRIAKLK